MLTKEETLLRVEDGRVLPDKLVQSLHSHYLAFAEEMLEIFRQGIGQTREELRDRIKQLFWDEPCDPRRVRAFCKLLEDEAEFEGMKRDAASRLRMRVFQLAAPKHPVVGRPKILLEQAAASVKEGIAKELGRPWTEIEGELYSDVYDLHRLKAPPAYSSAESLLTRYNEAQLQAALYRATEMTVFARGDYKSIVRAAKAAGLMFSATRQGDGFLFIFNGPTSVLRETTRYGVRMAWVVPTLLRCHDWEMWASIYVPRHYGKPMLKVGSASKYRSSHKEQAEFDSGVESQFAAKWGADRRDGWILMHESEPRFIGQEAFFPDFSFEHESGISVLFEIIGYWTPEYLAKKREKLLQFRGEPLLLAIRQNASTRFDGMEIPTVPYKSALKLEPILAALQAFLASGR